MDVKLKNRYGEIPVGTKVFFSVENQNTWIGPVVGVLEHDGAEFIIKTEKGIVTINKGYDAYINTIQPM